MLGLLDLKMVLLKWILRNKKLLEKIVDKNKKVVCMNKIEKRLSKKGKERLNRRSSD